jgi:hypothetical protein
MTYQEEYVPTCDECGTADAEYFVAWDRISLCPECSDAYSRQKDVDYRHDNRRRKIAACQACSQEERECSSCENR